MNRRTGLAGSFRNAFRGIATALRSEPNARIHLAATGAVIAAGYWFRCSPGEWAVIAIATGFVWTAELLNTAIEKSMDLLHPDHHPLVKNIKDIAAGAVLLAAIAAVVAAGCIFLPKIL
ncbi:diacylglycerol kinase family protein [Chitinophaga pollutisoli]|uniref:Diacylglycerol kinase family protein n=1 Tax=Chitinophaga pollutisoli TaxID=3133966 RepID=A0ABZ2YIX1_9BACT